MLDFTDEVLNRMKESLWDNNAFAAAFSFLSFFFLFSVCTRKKIEKNFTKENTSNVGRQEQFKGIVVRSFLKSYYK